MHLLKIVNINCTDNNNADTLTCLTTNKDVETMKLVPIKVLFEPSIDKKAELLEVDHEFSWIDPIRAYLEHDILPEDKVEAKSLEFLAYRYVVVSDKLYKRGLRPLL